MKFVKQENIKFNSNNLKTDKTLDTDYLLKGK